MENQLSRRSALAALAGAGVLSSVPVASAVLDTGAPAVTTQDDWNEGHAAAMEVFAIAWLARWTEHGGSVTIDPLDSDRAWIGHPMPNYGKEGERQEAFFAGMREQEWFQQKSEQEQERIIRDHRSFNCTFYTGKMRELSDLLEAMPGGHEAVKRFVRAFPWAGFTPVFDTQAKEA